MNRPDAESELLQLFHDEAEDFLGQLETCLLTLENSPESRDAVDESFRLLHTLKGTCSMYGFADASGLAHEVETLFDRVRRGTLSVTPQLIELALSARDALAALVSGSEQRATDTRQLTQVLMDGMQELASQDGDAAAAEPDDFRVSEQGSGYRIDIHPRGDLFIRGISLTGLLSELATLGETSVAVDATNVPMLEDIDPETLYLSLAVDLHSSESRESVEAVLMFLDESEYSISSLEAEDAGVHSDRGAGAVIQAGGSARVRHGGGVRVSPERLDEMVDLVGELVTTHARLRDEALASEEYTLLEITETLERLAHDMRQTVLDMRMVPIGGAFGRFTRYVRDLAKELGKDVALVTDGGTTELDRMVIERIEEPLLHVIRNCIDHGIETPIERRLAGKPEQGTIRLSAYHAGGSVYVEIADDGRGLDLDVIREKAVAAGHDPESEWSHGDLVDMVFGAGFSTATQVTSVSGRGVGLDVVKKAVEDLQGTVELVSQPGAGLRVIIRLPLTLAIVDGLLVSVCDERYIVPSSMVEECIELSQQAGWQQHGRDLIEVRGETLPFVRLREFFDIAGEDGGDAIAVVLMAEGKRFGLVVDRVVDRLPFVIKPLGRALKRAEGVLGATTLGDGSVALIVDTGHVYRITEDAASWARGAALQRERPAREGPDVG